MLPRPYERRCLQKCALFSSTTIHSTQNNANREISGVRSFKIDLYLLSVFLKIQRSKLILLTWRWPSWKNSVIFTNGVVVFLIDIFVIVVLVIIIIVNLGVFVVFFVNTICNCNCKLLWFLLLSKFYALETFGFTSLMLALLLAPSYFHLWKIFAFYLLFLRFIGVIKKRISLAHEANRVENVNRCM